MIQVHIPLFGHNFLIRYPDSFGQRRKKLDTVQVYNIFQAEGNQTSTFQDIAVQRFYQIWAYHKVG